MKRNTALLIGGATPKMVEPENINIFREVLNKCIDDRFVMKDNNI